MAEQGIAVFLGPVGQVGDEAFHLLTGGLPKGLGAAVVDRIGLDQAGIELVLTDQLAEAIAQLRTAVVAVLAIDRLGRELLRVAGGSSRFGKRPDFLD